MTASVSDGSDNVERERTLVEEVFARREFGVVVAVLGLIIIGSVVRADVFLTLGNLVGVLRNVAVIAIIGYGMALLMTSGEFDLSVGSLMGMSAGITAVLLLDGFSIWFVYATVVILAVLYGILQGVLVTKLGLPSLIVTIGTLTLIRGGHLALLGNVTQTVPSEIAPLGLWALGGTVQLPFQVVVPFAETVLFTIPVIVYQIPGVHAEQQAFNSFPLQIFWVLLLGLIFHYILFYTKFGYHAQVTGGNIQAADYTGINTDQVKIAGFVLIALLASFAGIGQLAFTGNVSPLTGDGTELIVVAAVVIGGTDLFGGEGTMGGTILGALVFALTQNILVLAGFGTQLFAIFTGVFIIFAVAVDALTRRARYDVVRDEFLTPIKDLLIRPSEYFTEVNERVQGTDKPIGFVAIIALLWMLPMLLIIVLTFVPSAENSVIPGSFELFIVQSGIGAVGTLPLVAFVLTGIVALITTGFLHLATSLMGEGDINRSVQAVAYSMAPWVFVWVPLTLEGLRFIFLVVAVTFAPIILASFVLLYIALRQLFDMRPNRSVIAILVTLLLWVLLWLVFGGEVGL